MRKDVSRGFDLFLTVGCVGSVLALVVMVADVVGDSSIGSAEQGAAEGDTGDIFQQIGVFDGLGRRFSPGKGGMAADQDSRNGKRVELQRSEVADDDGASVAHISLFHFG